MLLVASIYQKKVVFLEPPAGDPFTVQDTHMQTKTKLKQGNSRLY